MADLLKIGDLELRSRVMLGTAAYRSRDLALQSLEASGCEMVTVSLRRVQPGVEAEDLYEQLIQRSYRLLPNTAGCFTAREAVMTAHVAREALGTSLLKLEVIADEELLLPEPQELLAATEQLVRDGFQVLPYTNDDPVLARKLEDLGAVAVMPLAAPIGTGLGIRNPHNLQLIKARAHVPVIVDAGLGTASDVALAFEIGCDAVLLNSAVARANDPVEMARAIGYAARAGRCAYLAGRIPKRTWAIGASSLQGRAFH
jgi:thiazole synthase